MRAGVVVRIPPREESGASAARLGFVDAREVRRIVLPETVRVLGETAGAHVALAVVEGRVHAAFHLGGGDATGPALLISGDPRGDALVALGLEILDSGRFTAAPDGAGIVWSDGSVAELSLVAELRAIDAAAWSAHGALGLGHVVGMAAGERS